MGGWAKVIALAHNSHSDRNKSPQRPRQKILLCVLCLLGAHLGLPRMCARVSACTMTPARWKRMPPSLPPSLKKENKQHKKDRRWGLRRQHARTYTHPHRASTSRLRAHIGCRSSTPLVHGHTVAVCERASGCESKRSYWFFLDSRATGASAPLPNSRKRSTTAVTYMTRAMRTFACIVMHPRSCV